MNTKKFVNLSAKYKDILDKIIKIFNKKDIKNIANNTLSSKRIFEIFNNINELLNKNDCGPYDINHIIINYDKKNVIIDILKKYINLKNKLIISTATKSYLWKKFIKQILNKYNKLFTIKINYDIIEKAFFYLLKKYKIDWLGYWTIIDINNTGTIKNINIFDTEDIDNMLLFIAKNSNWKLKDKNEIKRLQSFEKTYKILI